MHSVTSKTLEFLLDLKKNNNREWFEKNKSFYLERKKEFESFVAELLENVRKFDPIKDSDVSNSVYRIYRDVRFSQDKTPYKVSFSVGYGHDGRKSPYMDYYFHLQPGNESFLGAGLYAPSAEQLKKFRQEIDFAPKELLAIIHNSKFKKCFGEPVGEKLSRPPKGYAIDHQYIELLKHKQFFFMTRFTDTEVQKPDFAQKLADCSEILKPFIDYLNRILFEDIFVS
jgi:uncharacterized protein (TIGR02453 family)